MGEGQMGKRRRFCRGCGTRIHRAAYRCHHCDRTALPLRFYVTLAISLPLVYLALKYLRVI
jgi:hypothetical protein